MSSSVLHDSHVSDMTMDRNAMTLVPSLATSAASVVLFFLASGLPSSGSGSLGSVVMGGDRVKLGNPGVCAGLLHDSITCSNFPSLYDGHSFWNMLMLVGLKLMARPLCDKFGSE